MEPTFGCTGTTYVLVPTTLSRWRPRGRRRGVRCHRACVEIPVQTRREAGRNHCGNGVIVGQPSRVSDDGVLTCLKESQGLSTDRVSMFWIPSPGTPSCVRCIFISDSSPLRHLLVFLVLLAALLSSLSNESVIRCLVRVTLSCECRSIDFFHGKVYSTSSNS
jgi:hypothetical protein